MSLISTTDSAQATTSCAWETSDPQYVAYHNEQWGKPVFDSQELFAKLCLDGQQAGLSWLTILRKQKNYEKAFHQFNPLEIVKMTEDDVMTLMQDRGIVRNKLKIKSIITNAHAYLYIEEAMPFNLYLWQFTQYRVIQNNCKTKGDVATTSAASDAMAKALKKAGFSFVGSTICYAFMQAVGMINDHLVDCYRHSALKTAQEQVEKKLLALQRSKPVA
ncbi:MAG: DNA-3-methyladenine glycosylase I [Glaciecola sp.]|jgi:DNA-3-methyladenine glycosylase I